MLISTSPPNFLERQQLKINATFSMILRLFFGFSQHQLIICGFPRSGTSLLYNMISSTLPGFRYEEFENYFIYRIHRLGNIATKAPMDILHIKHIDKMNINHKSLIILIMVRDIRDIITSRHPILPNEFFIGYDHSWWPQNKEFSKWSYDAPGIAEIYNEIQSIKNRPDALVIRYEDLIAQTDNVQDKIAEKFGIKFTNRFKDYHLYPNKHAYRYEGRFAAKDEKLVLEGKPLSKERVARWRKDPELINRIREQFDACEILFDILMEYGYESSRTWINDL